MAAKRMKEEEEDEGEDGEDEGVELEMFVPGRVMLFGEHADWAGSLRRINPSITVGCGVVLPTNQGLWARCKRGRGRFILQSPLGRVDLPMLSAALLNEARDPLSKFSYACGTCFKILTDFHVEEGAEIENFEMTLPIGKGLSSSAAICVCVAKAFNTLYNLKLTTRGIMEIAYQGEILTQSKCGRADQALAYGAPVLLTYDGDLLHVEEISFKQDEQEEEGSKLHLVIVDLCASKSTTAILTGLQSAYPFPKDEKDENCHLLFGKLNEDIVQRALKIFTAPNGDLEQQRAKKLGELMNEAQVNFDKYATPLCPDQLTAPVLHSLLNCPDIQPFIYGGKGIGSGGDGSAQLVCKDSEAQSKVIQIIEDVLNMKAIPLTL